LDLIWFYSAPALLLQLKQKLLNAPSFAAKRRWREVVGSRRRLKWMKRRRRRRRRRKGSAAAPFSFVRPAF
jgi:hypothetical protein